MAERAKIETTEAHVREASGPAGPERRERDRFGWDDLLPEASSDETDAGWGEARPAADPADLRRFLDDKPPHHL
ncbi:hypothetical protein ACFZBU_37695 [Embleya sp. NPDC008237]|uniref:hypothetical protein n=1 Tax=Embleya sp. NPDC008237 TaxID=3363978 RepID=UPI0036ED3EE4